MKRLTLVRHAKSSWDDAALADRDRPLAPRGKRDAPRMGERLRIRKARPSLILTSPAKRARATAKILARALHFPKEFLHTEPDLYLAGVHALLGVVYAQNDRCADLMLVGHNPGLTDFVNTLLPKLRLDNLPTTGIVAVDLDVDQWADVGRGRAELVYYDYPKNPEVVIGDERQVKNQ